MTDELENTGGVSRRSMLKKSALVGGTMVWAAPVVQSITSPAFGQTEPTPEENGVSAISFVALLLTCGGLEFRVKFEADDGFALDPVNGCGPSFAVDACNDQLKRGDANIQTSCPPVTATFNSVDGTLTVHLGTCVLDDYVVKCGAGAYSEDASDGTGCQDPPNEVMTPLLGSNGDVTFFPCDTDSPTTGS